MSRAVSDHLTWFVHSEGVTLAPTKRAGTSNQRLVLLNLCAHADHAGCAWPSQSRMAKVLGISRQTVQDCLSALEEQGYLERLNKNGKPGALVRWRVLPTVLAALWTAQPDGRPDGQPDGRPDGLARHEGEVEGKYPPTPKRERRPGAAQGGGKEWGELHQQVLSGCLERERKGYQGNAGKGLLRTWEKDYRPLIAQAMHEQPNADTQTLVTWCYAARNGQQEPTVQDRHRCADAIETAYRAGQRGDALRQAIGTYSQKAQQEVWDWFCRKYPDAQSPIDTPDRHTERVSTDEGANTDTPGPGGPADPRSAAVYELPRIGRAV